MVGVTRNVYIYGIFILLCMTIVTGVGGSHEGGGGGIKFYPLPSIRPSIAPTIVCIINFYSSKFLTLVL